MDAGLHLRLQRVTGRKALPKGPATLGVRPRPMRGYGRPIVVAVAALAVAVGFGGCGGGESGAGSSSDAAAAKTRAAQLLNSWSDTLTTTLQAANARKKAREAGDLNKYTSADTRFSRGLRRVKRFAPQGRAVMSQYVTSNLTRAVVRDGDKWQEWALASDDRNVSLTEAQRIANLAMAAIKAHEEAYAAAGAEPPPAFQRRPDQQ